jgi:hypothetical protein
VQPVNSTRTLINRLPNVHLPQPNYMDSSIQPKDQKLVSAHMKCKYKRRINIYQPYIVVLYSKALREAEVTQIGRRNLFRIFGNFSNLHIASHQTRMFK